MLDFNADVERFLLACGTDLTGAMTEYAVANSEEFSVLEYFQQSKDRKTCVQSPSSLSCVRKLFFGLTGTKKEKKVTGSGFSTMFTGFVLGKMFSHLATHIYGGEGEIAVDIPSLSVWGHCDHMFFTNEGKMIVLEFKTSAKTIYEGVPPNYYLWQTSAYATGLGADEAYLIMFWMDGRTFRTVPVDIEKGWTEARRRFTIAREYAEKGFPPAAEAVNEYITCRSCSYQTVCKQPGTDRLLQAQRRLR